MNKIRCKYKSRNGNCKIAKNPRNGLNETCLFKNGFVVKEKNSSLTTEEKKVLKSGLLAKMISQCYAQKRDFLYWDEFLTSQVQKRIDHIERSLST